MTDTEVKEKVIFLSDRGPNIKYGLINAGYIRLNCYAHLIHNLVSNMLSKKSVQEMITQAAKLTAYVKNSGMNSQLKSFLKLYTKTRWNSVFTMFDSIITEYQTTYDLLLYKQRVMNEHGFKNSKQPDNSLSDLITVINLPELIKIKTFLEPFKVGNKKNRHILLK